MVLRHLFLAVLVLFSISSFAEAAGGEEDIEGSLQRSFANYLLRGLEEVGESPNHHTSNTVKRSLRGTLELLDFFVSETQGKPLAGASFSGRHYRMLHNLYHVSLVRIMASENFFSDLSQLNPAQARAWMVGQMLSAKEELLSEFAQYLDELHVLPADEIASTYSRGDFSRDALITSALLAHRFELGTREQQIFDERVAQPWAGVVVEHMQWLSSVDPNLMAEYQHRILSRLSILSRPRHYAPLLRALLQEDNRHLWVPNVRVRNRNHQYAAFHFVTSYLPLLLGAIPGGDGLPLSTVEDVVKIALGEERAGTFHRVWKGFFPEAITEYLLSPTETEDPGKFLSSIQRIFKTWPTADQVLAGDRVVSQSSAFATYMYWSVDQVRESLTKGLGHLNMLVKMLFTADVPPPDTEVSKPFAPSASSVVVEMTNVRSILDGLIWNLTGRSPHPHWRLLFERYLYDFVHLSERIEKLFIDHYEQLVGLFRFYKNLGLRSRWIERLAMKVIEDSRTPSHLKLSSINYLLVVDPESYAFLHEIKREVPAQRSGHLWRSQHGTEVHFSSEPDGEVQTSVSFLTLEEMGLDDHFLNPKQERCSRALDGE